MIVDVGQTRPFGGDESTEKVGPANGGLSEAEMRILGRKRRKGGRSVRENRGNAQMKNLGEMGIEKMLAGKIANGRKNFHVKRRATGMGTG